jgi:error-prone DNA polymerase
LDRLGVINSTETQRRSHGQKARVAGLVIARQRPASANNVTFVTLEDEAGSINLVVWKRLAERQRQILLGARLLGAIGEIQREGDVLHLVAGHLEDYSAMLSEFTSQSRDFH